MKDTLFLKLERQEECWYMDQEIPIRFTVYVSEYFKICRPINL